MKITTIIIGLLLTHVAAIAAPRAHQESTDRVAALETRIETLEKQLAPLLQQQETSTKPAKSPPEPANVFLQITTATLANNFIPLKHYITKRRSIGPPQKRNRSSKPFKPIFQKQTAPAVPYSVIASSSLMMKK